MRARMFIGAVLVVAGFGSGMTASGDHGRAAARQWAIVYLLQPTLVGSTIVQGPVLFTHDPDKMARGEACTSVRLVESVTEPFEEIASFHCIPRPGTAPNHFTLTTRPNLTDGIGCVLTAYQFAGDPEVHGVPLAAIAH